MRNFEKIKKKPVIKKANKTRKDRAAARRLKEERHD